MNSNEVPPLRPPLTLVTQPTTSETHAHVVWRMGQSSLQSTSKGSSNLGKMLKSVPSEAELSRLKASKPRPPSITCVDDDALLLSSSTILTPRSLLFNHADMHPSDSMMESDTLGSSWSSCSKMICGSYESQESALTSCEEVSPEIKAESESNLSSSTVTAEDRLQAVCELMNRQKFDSNSSIRRARSCSDLGPRRDSWETLHPENSKMEEALVPPRVDSSHASVDVTSQRTSPSVSPSNISTSLSPVPPSLDAKGPDDLSAYVSGIGVPIDPDIEMSTFVQLQTFRSHTRSRSVGRFDSRRERSKQQGKTRGNMDERMANMLGLSPRRFTSMTSPRPPLALIRDTEQIPALDDLGSAVCNPGYVLHSKKPDHPSETSPTSHLDDTPPASPILKTPTEALEPIPDDADLSLESHSDLVDEHGFELVVPRRKPHRRHHRSGRSHASDSDVTLIDMNAQVEDEDEESRSRGRCTSVKSIEPSGSLDMACSKLGVSHRRSTRRRRNDLTYSAALQAPSESRGRPKERGHRERVKIVVSSNESSDPEKPVPNILSVDTSLDDLQNSPRSRLLSNSSHLLMLSLEVAMIQHDKIHAPLKPRWGKRRDDDFQPLPRMDARIKQFLTDKKLKYAPSSVKTPSLYHYVDDCGSRLKYNLEASCP